MKRRRTSRTVRWNKTEIDRLPTPAKGQRDIWYHETFPGLCVAVTDRSKTYYLAKRVDGQQQRILIGKHEAWTPAAALTRATEIAQAIDRGENPHEDRIGDRDTPTLNAYWKLYDQHHVERNLKPNSRVLYRGIWRLYLAPKLGAKRINSISRSDVKRLHAEVQREAREKMQAKRRKGDGGRTANCAVNVLRGLLNDAIDSEVVAGPNPAERIKKAKENRRDRFLGAAEIVALFDALEADARERNDWTWCDLFRLLVWTGARRGNMLSMRWQDLDLDGRRWMIPAGQTKTGAPYLVHLAGGAVEILRQRRLQAPQDACYVFPGRRAGQALTAVKNAWKRVTERAGITNCTIHDLRHTTASLMAASGASLPMIGAQLGHASPATTARYAHLVAHAVQEAVDRATAGLPSTSSIGG